MIKQRKLWAILPVKRFEFAKQRLSSVLSSNDRTLLSQTMFLDVLEAVVSAACFDGIIVVSRDKQAQAWALDQGASVLQDDAETGTNDAVIFAIRSLADDPAAGVIVLPTDIPQLSPQTIINVAHVLQRPPAIVLAKAAQDGGTNLFACSPYNLIEPQFGNGSFARHLAAASLAVIDPVILSPAEIGCDLDQPQDVPAFLARRSSTRTQAFLSRSDITCHMLEVPDDAESNGAVRRRPAECLET